MNEQSELSCVFLTYIKDKEDLACVKILIKSLRDFGGTYSKEALYVFMQKRLDAFNELVLDNVFVIPIELDEPLHSYPFAYKVFAVSALQDFITPLPTTIIWLDPSAIILRQPSLFDLKDRRQLALRPVHVKNVGICRDDAIDTYWSHIYNTVEVEYGSLYSVKSYVDQEDLFPYYNCGIYALHHHGKVLSMWWDVFKKLVLDVQFQGSHCASCLHKVFLHQSIFSALICKHLSSEDVRILPPEYGYPLHFHNKLSSMGKQIALEDVVCMLGYNEDMSKEEKLEIFQGSPSRIKTWLLQNAI